MCDRNKIQHLQQRHFPTTCQIKLSSINILSSSNNHSLYSRKVHSLVNENLDLRNGRIYQLSKLPKEANKTVLCSRSQTDSIRIDNENITYFAERVRKSIVDDIANSTRYAKTDNLKETKTFSLTPIKLYKHHLLSKFCRDSSLALKIECKKFLNRVEFKYTSQESVKNIENTQQKSSIRHLKTEDKVPDKGHQINGKTDLDIINNLFDYKHYDKPLPFFELNKELTRFQNALKKKPDLITENYESFLLSDYVKFSTKMSTENVQELPKISLTNGTLKQKKSEPDMLKDISNLSFKKSESLGQSIMSCSQPFSEINLFEDTPTDTYVPHIIFDKTDVSLNDTYGNSQYSPVSFKTDGSFSLSETDDLAFNESELTKIALLYTDYYTDRATANECRTLSGFFMGYDDINTYSQHQNPYQGNYGYIDGINFKTKIYKKSQKLEVENLSNETFSALSHMYSFRKLMDRRSVTADSKASFSPNTTLFIHDNEDEKEEFISESSNDISLKENFQSFDLKLIEKFKQRHL